MAVNSIFIELSHPVYIVAIRLRGAVILFLSRHIAE